MKEIKLLKIIFKDSPDILKPLNEIEKEIERLNNIIKEVREYIDKEHKLLYLDKSGYTYTKIGNDILEILDKGDEIVSTL